MAERVAAIPLVSHNLSLSFNILAMTVWTSAGLKGNVPFDVEKLAAGAAD